MPSEKTMRSELVFRVATYISNRYLLTKIASKAIRELHRPNTRIQQTTNDALIRFSQVDPLSPEPNNYNVQKFNIAA